MQERLTITIPTSNKWHTEDLEKKAEKLGMNKGDFLLEAVNMMMCFDDVFLKKLENQSEALKIPVWLLIQNTIIKNMAEDAAKVETKTARAKLMPEFSYIQEGETKRIVTGEELFDMLKDNFVHQIKIQKGKSNL